MLLLAVLASGRALEAKKPDKAATQAQPAAAPGGWPEITAEEKAFSAVPQDPQAEAVLLRHDREGKIQKIADDTVNVMTYHWRVKVLKPGGKWLGEVKIPGGKYSRVSDIQARTVKADGTIVPVTPDQIFEKVESQVGSAKFTQWVFNFPAVEPGAILEYRYQRRVDNVFAISPWYFEGPVFTVRSRFVQSVPQGMGYTVLCDLCQGVQPVVSEYREGSLKGQTYTVELKNQPGYREEVFMPPPREVSPRLEMVMQFWKNIYWTPLGRQDNLFTDWASVGKLAGANYRDGVKDGAEALPALVAGWTEGAADPLAKTKAIFRHVQRDFRYVAYDDVYGGIRPLKDILKSGWADNEEKAVLLQAALKAAGIDSNLALVSGKNAGGLNPKFFSLTQFTHVVVLIPQGAGSPTVLDPTVTYAPYGFMPWQDSGAGALFLKEGTGEVGTLPTKGELSTTKLKVNVKPRPDGKADLDIEARFTGEGAISMREDLAPVSEALRKEGIGNWLENGRAGAVLGEHSVENLENTDEPLILKLKAEAPDLVTLAEGAESVRGCVLFCIASNPFAHDIRQHPLYVDRGWNTEQVVTIQPPEGMKPLPPGPGFAVRSPVASLTMRCSTGDADEVKCTRQYTAARNRWNASEMSSVREMYDKVIEADGTRVAFQAAAATSN
jgi:transglutaminase-like putative cysteine protease